MTKLIKRILSSVIYRLGVVNEKIENKQKAIDEQIWLSKFNSSGYFDYNLAKDLKIRLYKDSILTKIIYEGFETDEIEFASAFLREGDIFFDIGANIGLFSLIAAKKVGVHGLVYAFEPSPTTFFRLDENVQSNKLDNVRIFNMGLSDSKGILKLNVSEDGHDAWNSFAKLGNINYEKFVDVEVNSLDAFIVDNKVDRIDLIKLDVEGWEKFVLMGAEKFLRENSPVLMVEFTESNTFSAGYLVQDLYDILHNWGYSWYRYENGELVTEIKKLHYPYDNLFAIKDLSAVLARIVKS